MASNADGNPEPERKGGCILTYTGATIYPLDPREDEVNIYDIAHALANICRYTGHVSSFYSVAQHSVLVSEACEDRVARPHEQEETKQMALEGLMHDASEAYLGDVARPIKQNSYVGTLYTKAEDRLMAIIADKYGTTWPVPEIVKWADQLLLRTEQRDLMPYPNDLYNLDEHEKLDKIITPWSPEEAEIEFIDRYKELALADKRVGLSAL